MKKYSFILPITLLLSFMLLVSCGSKNEKVTDSNDIETVDLSDENVDDTDIKDIDNEEDDHEMNQDAIDAAEKMVGGTSKSAAAEMRKAQKEAADEMRKAQKEAAAEMKKAQEEAAAEMRKAMGQ